MRVTDFKYYSGDVSLEYGGFFADLSEWDYVPVLRVTDLDSATGFDGAVMVERLIVIVPRNRKELRSCLFVCGQEDRTEDLWTAIQSGNVSDNDKMLIIDVCLSYGLYDPDQQGYYVNPRWPQSSHEYSAQNMIIIQCEPVYWYDAIEDSIKDRKKDLDILGEKLTGMIESEMSDIEYLEKIDSIIEDSCLGFADSIRNDLVYSVEQSPMEYDGWKADIRLPEDQDLFSYLLDNGYLRDFE